MSAMVDFYPVTHPCTTPSKLSLSSMDNPDLENNTISHDSPRSVASLPMPLAGNSHSMPYPLPCLRDASSADSSFRPPRFAAPFGACLDLPLQAFIPPNPRHLRVRFLDRQPPHDPNAALEHNTIYLDRPLRPGAPAGLVAQGRTFAVPRCALLRSPDLLPKQAAALRRAPCGPAAAGAAKG
jgi:hypothetical protein